MTNPCYNVEEECYDSKCPTLVKYGLGHVFISS